MRATAILLATGKIPSLLESVASFLTQDHEDSHLIIVNAVQRQTLVFDHPKVTVFNVKQTPCLPMKARNYAMTLVSEGAIIAWPEDGVALPGFLSSVASALDGREWCWFEKEYVFEAGQHMKLESASEFSFAFTKMAFDKCGPFLPGINGSSERNLVGRIVSMFPGEKTAVTSPNLIRVGNRDEREQVTPSAVCGHIKLAPAMTRDWQSLAQVAQSGKRKNSVCIVELGRNGDIINILPFCKMVADRYQKPHLMVAREFLGLLDGVSYVIPYPTDLHYAKLGQALRIAKADHSIVVNCQIYGEEFQQTRMAKSFNEESFRNAGIWNLFKDNTLRPEFDLRDRDREKVLVEQVRGDDRREMILVNASAGISSPCPQCTVLLDEIRRVWGEMYNVVDLTQVKGDRFYDLLGLYEASKALCSIDTAHLHLCAGTNIPVVALLQPKAEGWAGTQVRGGNCVASIFYNDVLRDNCQSLHESLAAALERPNPTIKARTPKKKVERRIFHMVDRHEDTDKAVIERKSKMMASWDPLYESGQLIPAHCWSYPRNARDILGDQRPLPYLRDLIINAAKQCRDNDILLFTNDDNWLHQDLPEYLQFHVGVYGPCSIFRTEIRGSMPGPQMRPEQIAGHSREKHVGRDGFAFTRAWLEDVGEDFPDAVLAASDWDIHLACLIRLHYGIVTTGSNIFEVISPAEIPKGYTMHLAHQSAWSLNQHDSPANNWNGQQFKTWAAHRLPLLKLTEHGNLA